MVAEAALAGGLDKGTTGDRYQVVLHVDAAALAERRDVPAGTSNGAAGGSGRSAERFPPERRRVRLPEQGGTDAAGTFPQERPGR